MRTPAPGAAYGLGAAFGSMIVAGLIFMVLTVPIGRFGAIERLGAFAGND